MRLVTSGLLALFLSTGCGEALEVYRNPDVPTDPTDDTGTPPDNDVDNDGHTVEVDCDDNDASVGPATAWYPDTDGDGWGFDSSIQYACAQPDGHIAQGGDCDDEDPEVYPGAQEVCNGVDDDCDNTVDNSQTNQWYLDHDGDGWGDPAYEYTDGCDGSTYLVSNADDCDDNDASINPEAEEVCNGVDDDCDDTTDVGATDASAWFEDADSDGYGNVDEYHTSCEMPEGYVGDWTDCNDANPVMYPGATEVCDEFDNDCDLETDEADGNPDVLELWPDGDSDSYGDDAAGSSTTCPADGLVEQGGDCDDTDPQVNPDATEVCDDLDNDCDGSTDPETSIDVLDWYADNDGDGFGNSLDQVWSCDQPTGFVADITDCDDAESAVNPGATEVCNDLDDDCDGSTDVGATDASTWYPDTDGDSFGNASGTTVTQCNQPSGYELDSTDCDDGDGASYPGGTEVCDSADNNCDGDIDEGPIGEASYPDTDGDGYGNDSVVPSLDCEAPSGYVGNNDDCDDSDSSVFSGATEYCNEVDDDCDLDTDEGVENTFYQDADGDGYGNVDSTTDACLAPSGYVEDDTDCDDGDASSYPGATEVCNDLDDDCDGDIDPDDSVDAGIWYEDSDSDTFGNPDSTTESCSAPEGYVNDDTDCDDESAATYPDAPESCDGEDNDCNGSIDENLSSEWFVDTDGDLYGAGDPIDVICGGDSADLVDNADDCDDGEPTAFPGGVEVCGDGIDQDCSGADEECPEEETESDTGGDTATP